MSITPILPQVYRIGLLGVNVYLLAEDTGITLIDAGFVWTAPLLLRRIVATGHDPRQVRRILVTHTDGDHVGGIPALLRVAPQAQVLAAPLEAQALREGRFSRPLRAGPPLRWLLPLTALPFRVPAVPQVEDLEPETTLPIFGGLQVLLTPGHTPQHLAFYLPRQGVLFAGDAVRHQGGRLVVSHGLNTWDQAQACASARRLAALEPEWVCPGHRQVLHRPRMQVC